MSKIIKAKDLKRTDNYYYVQTFPRGKDWYELCFIVFADNKAEAMTKTREYLNKHLPAGYCIKDEDNDICLYHRNYILRARTLVADGKFI